MANKYSIEELEEAVGNSTSLSDVLRYLGYTKIVGGSITHLKNKIERLSIDFSHFTGQGHRKGKSALNKLTPEEIFVILPEGSHRQKGYRLARALIEVGIEHKCDECGCNGTYNNKPLTLQVDHIDGNYFNNLQKNLRFLCPNCHTQTSNYGNKN